MKHFIAIVGLMLMSWSQALATEVEDVLVADTANVGGQVLLLNGAGVRSKLFFDIYIGALYLPAKTGHAEKIISSVGNKRVWMYFLYSEVGHEKLVDGWNKGFKKNQSKADMVALQPRLDAFNAFFTDMKKGDELTFDFIAEQTLVYINGHQAGSIAGNDFQQALLAVWLGKEPADDGLKAAMLGDD